MSVKYVYMAGIYDKCQLVWNLQVSWPLSATIANFGFRCFHQEIHIEYLQILHFHMV